MRLGISAAFPHSSPEEWAALHREAGLGAVVFPLNWKAEASAVDRYAEADRAEGLVISEVGAWCNPMDPDPAKRKENRLNCLRQLELAEYVGAVCCVNISGAVGGVWDGCYAENYARETREEMPLSRLTLQCSTNFVAGAAVLHWTEVKGVVPTAARNSFHLSVGELVALRLGERQHLLGGLARLRLLAQLGAEVQVVDVHNVPFSRCIDARLRNRAEPISIVYSPDGVLFRYSLRLPHITTARRR